MNNRESNEKQNEWDIYIRINIDLLTTGIVSKYNNALVSIVAADTLVLKHQVINSHNIDSIPMIPIQFHINSLA